MRPLLPFLVCFPLLPGAEGQPAAPAPPRHVMVYHQPGRFAGWPANHGIWSWGDEILVGFSVGTYKDLGPDRHAIDREKPEEHLFARSRDGGLTWAVEDPSKKGALVPAGRMLHGVPPPGLQERPWRDCEGGIDFTHPDFAMTLRMTDAHGGEAGRAGGPAVLRPHHGRRPHLEVPRLDRGRTQGLRHHALHGAARAEGDPHRRPPPGGHQGLARDVPVGRRRRDLEAGHGAGPRPGDGEPGEHDPPAGRPGVPDLRGAGRPVLDPRPPLGGRRADVGRGDRPAGRGRRGGPGLPAQRPAAGREGRHRLLLLGEEGRPGALRRRDDLGPGAATPGPNVRPRVR